MQILHTAFSYAESLWLLYQLHPVLGSVLLFGVLSLLSWVEGRYRQAQHAARSRRHAEIALGAFVTAWSQPDRPYVGGERTHRKV